MPDNPGGDMVLADKRRAAEAAVMAFLDGDAATSQHIVDTLGARARPTQDPAEAEKLDWS